jgi:hypothetical protein
MLEWAGFLVKAHHFSNCLQIPVIKNFRLKLNTLAMSFYLLATGLVPKFRYLMIVVGQKEGK